MSVLNLSLCDFGRFIFLETPNLALACPYCNRYKGTDLGSLDPETGQLTPFFNP